LEFALDQLWQRRTERGELTFAPYEELGGLEGALGRRAEEEFRKLPLEYYFQPRRAISCHGMRIGAV
jgi:hypothetical protein